jgi:hypothetical protein
MPTFDFRSAARTIMDPFLKLPFVKCKAPGSYGMSQERIDDFGSIHNRRSIDAQSAEIKDNLRRIVGPLRPKGLKGIAKFYYLVKIGISRHLANHIGHVHTAECGHYRHQYQGDRSWNYPGLLVGKRKLQNRRTCQGIDRNG